MIFNVHHICAHCYLIECKNWGEKTIVNLPSQFYSI